MRGRCRYRAGMADESSVAQVPGPSEGRRGGCAHLADTSVLEQGLRRAFPLDAASPFDALIAAIDDADAAHAARIRSLG